jgi:CxxC-x17-CxxC domain-containing protein
MAEKEMHKAVCAECGKECEVPFKPDPSRPVYCQNAGRRKEQQEEDSKSS